MASAKSNCAATVSLDRVGPDNTTKFCCSAANTTFSQPSYVICPSYLVAIEKIKFSTILNRRLNSTF